MLETQKSFFYNILSFHKRADIFPFMDNSVRIYG